MFEARVGDETGSVSLKWFRGGESLAKQVRKDVLLLVSGDVKRYRFDKELSHPEISVISESESDAEDEKPQPSDGAGRSEQARLEDTRRIVPGYATPDGIHPRGLRRAIALAVETNVNDGNMTSSPGCRLHSIADISNAAVHDGVMSTF